MGKTHESPQNPLLSADSTTIAPSADEVLQNKWNAFQPQEKNAQVYYSIKCSKLQ